VDKYLTIISPNKYAGRRRPLRLIVWHSTESNEVRGGAYSIAANWFAKATSGVSAHIVVDDGTDPRYPSGIIECVYPGDTAWHCGNANADGYGIEIVGKAAQSGVDWNDAFSRAAIQNACEWLQWNDQLQHIPMKWLTDDELRSGASGHVTHHQVARVMGGSTHTDPGDQFPFSFVTALLDRHDVVLEYGMKNHPVVKKAQGFFQARYSYAKDLPATGNYLDQTVAVVKEFQARTGVTGPDANGRVIGPRTYAAMRREGWQ
jgi:N-acetyl-anhydromuramyl-L-alanine amidase AmpD